MKIRAQIGKVLNLDKCIGCHTCSVTCKNVWTSREGVEYAWFNNVETKPGLGYPKDWENQKRWNGGWVRHPGQEGGGLAAVREAMMWEIGFAPEACRKERVRGLVVVSLKDGSGSARLVLGENDWRWSDLLFVPATSAITFAQAGKLRALAVTGDKRLAALP